MLNYTFSRLFSNRWSEMTENNFEFPVTVHMRWENKSFVGFFLLVRPLFSAPHLRYIWRGKKISGQHSTKVLHHLLFCVFVCQITNVELRQKGKNGNFLKKFKLANRRQYTVRETSVQFRVSKERNVYHATVFSFFLWVPLGVCFVV